MDLPQKWRNKQIITHEQRLMALDGAQYSLFRYRYPELAKGSVKVLGRTSRKTGKTTWWYENRYCWWSVTHTGPNCEALLHAPNVVHMNPVEERIFSLIDTTPFLSTMLKSRNKEYGVAIWHTGITWHHRIEGVQGTGRNMVGLVASYVLGDEADYSHQAAYTERQQVALPDAPEFWGGVPRPGANTIFKSMVREQQSRLAGGKKKVEWSVHAQPINRWNIDTRRYDMRVSPLYHSNEAWERQIGNMSWRSDMVQTQVLGLDGEGGQSAFPNVPVAPLPFYHIKLTEADAREPLRIENTFEGLDFDMITGAEGWFMGIDYGFSPSPMIILVMYRKDGVLWEFARVECERFDNVDAANLIHALDVRLPGYASMISIDAHGQGRGVLGTLQKEERYEQYEYKARVVSANFQTRQLDPRIKVHSKCKSVLRFEEKGHEDSRAGGGPGFYNEWVCDSCGKFVYDDEVEDARVPAKVYYTTDLVTGFANGKRYLDTGQSTFITDPNFGVVLAVDDIELVNELVGTTSVMTMNDSVRFIPPISGQDHNSDSLRCIMSATRALEGNEVILESRELIREMGFYVITADERRRAYSVLST